MTAGRTTPWLSEVSFVAMAAPSSLDRTATLSDAIRRPDRWRRARALFEDALALETGDRRSFVRASAGPDRRLAEEVEGLLDAHERADAIEHPFFELLAPSRAQPERLGPYRLEAVLGTGGMGTVHLGRRVDGEVEQEVAIKVLRSDAASPRLAARLRRERQILARLDHPGLARLLDAGTTSDGRPYFVMERVHGAPLDRWVELERPGLERRLHLFARLCEAVEHAHAHGVVHRDLKPGNVLVDSPDRPRVVDFGVAAISQSGARRPLDGHPPDARAADEPLTETAGAPLTLRYASPEQLASGEPSPSADVYALGVILFELLCGRSPYGQSPSPLQIVEALLHGEAPAPSSVGPPAVVPSSVVGIPGRLLRGDLDAIVGKCLRRSPDQRYGSAGELAAEIRAHLARRPIAARTGLAYRLARRLRRQARGIVAAGLLLGSLGGAWWQHERAEGRLEVADRAAEDAASTLSELGDELARAGRGPEARRAFERAVELRIRLGGVGPTGSTGDSRAARLAGDLGALGDLEMVEGAYGEAARQHRRSLEVLASRGLERHPQAARSLSALGLAEARRGNVWAGEQRLLEGLELARSLFRAAPRARTRVLHDYGRYLSERGAFETASRVFAQALDMARGAFGEHEIELMTLRYDAATTAASYGRYAEAESLLESAGHGLAGLPGDHPLRLFDLERRAYLAFVDSRYAEAELDARQALDGALDRFGAAHPAVHAARRTLCQVLRDMRRSEEADEECARAVDVALALHGPGHPLVADALVMRAEAIEPLDRPRAMALLTDALTIYRSSVGEEHPMVARIFHYRSLERAVAGDLPTAEYYHRRAVELYRATV
ncbi:MAG: serine/threonine protein kinase, partial [Holophagales bacterium]|nr:serine/threonine protein kinase [Holophagales bacterium]